MRRSVLRLFCFLTLAVTLLKAEKVSAQAFPINSDVAIQPAEDQLLYRTQLRYRSAEIDDFDTDTELGVWSHVLVYGWTSRFSSVIGVPLIYRDIESAVADEDDAGIGDVKALLRYQLWKKLGYLESKSFTLLGGLEIPTFDEPFSSRSFDPIAGAVFSWRKKRHGFDADLIYQLNTENDRNFELGDLLRYDLVYQYRLWPARYASDTTHSLSGLLELNGEYQWESEASGRTLNDTKRHQIFLSPGLVLAGKRAKYEAGIQIPVYQDVEDSAPEDDIRLVIGLTLSF